MMRPLAAATLALLLSIGPAVCAQTAPWDVFVTRQGDQLMEGDRPLRFVSFNIPNLLVIEDAFEFLGDSPWRWPDEFEIKDALESVRQMGGRVARTYVLSVRREGSDMGECVHVLGPGKFNEEAFVALDRVLKAAKEKQIRVIIPLVDNWKWMGGVAQYAAFRGKSEAEFWTDRQLIDDFKQTIAYVVNRRNTLTGQLYSDDRAILGWETGNELDAPAEWTAEIAAYLKQMDRNHLVIDGRSLHGVPDASLEDANVDVVTTHHYPETGVNLVDRITAAAAAARGRKPYFVGEVGFISLDDAQRAFDAVVTSDAAGVLYWSLRFHRREGGFYWHSEPTGDNLFKAYHWPGFAAADSYQEQGILDLIAAYAKRIGDSPTSDDDPLPAPLLLPIQHPGRISWQGSTGATGYDVDRAVNSEGPWTTIAENVSDADTQYRPLFSDRSAQPGDRSWYRVTARYPSGARLPSNVVGPVAVDRMLLVDELQDDSLFDSTRGAARLRTSDTRRVQEDVHRMELGPGGSLTYKLPAAGAETTIWLFTPVESPACEVSTSHDGETFVPLTITTSSGRRGEGDYGYLQPVLVRTQAGPRDALFLRIANAATPVAASDSVAADGQRGDQTRFEVSRVEIGYGRDERRRTPRN